MSFTTMWLILSGIFFVVEIFTVGFLMFFPGVGAFLAFIASLLGANFTIQIIIFVASTTLMILFIRPIVTKLFKSKDTKMNSDVLIGKKGIVLKDIKGDEKIGQVKISGEIWSAISENDKELTKDTEVTVTSISGVKLIVKQVSN